MSRYYEIWNEIKRAEQCVFTISKAEAPTVIQGVLRTKSAENVARRAAGKVGWSKLSIKKEEISETHLRVTLALIYSTYL